MKRVWAFCISLIFCAAFLWGEEFTPGAIVLVLDNLRLRSTGSMDGAAIVTIQKGSLLEVIGTGKNETIDGIDSSWIKVKALESTQDKDGRLVQEEAEGWCFGGYLTTVKGGRDGKEIYTRTSDGFEKWYEYDENGRRIYMRNSDEIEVWYEYDENGNEIYTKSSAGFEEWSEYDKHGNEIHYKDCFGYESWHEYDKNGNKIYRKTSDGYEEWYEYDENGNEIYWKTSDGYEEWYEYDENGNEIYRKTSDGYEEWSEYDERGKLLA